jgi:hypothetical protein
MEMTFIFWILWVAPIFINFTLLYFDDDVKTYGDLFSNFYIHLIPVVNLTITLAFIVYSIEEKFGKYLKIPTEKWDKFMKTKIKK